MADLPEISVADLAEGAAHGPALDDSGRIIEPLIAVNLDDDVRPAVLARAAARARDCGRLLVGIAYGPLGEPARPLAEALDLTVTGAEDLRVGVPAPDPHEEVRVLGEAAVRNPHACVVLGRVLRITEAMPVPAALEAESFAYSALLGGPEFGRWLSDRGDSGDRRPPSPAREPVIVSRYDRRLHITLNRPERRNAYGRQLRDALTDALRVALFDPDVTTVVLDGAGPCFSSGGDLDEFGTTPDPVTAHLVRTHAGAGRLIHDLGARIEAHVHGPCVGAGVELAAFAGTVVAAEGTTFRLPETSMGLLPGAGGTVSIPRRIGRWRTLHLAVTGRQIDAGTALAWGLVDGLASPPHG